MIGLVLAAAWVAAACGFVETTPPAPTPADFIGISSELAKRGITVDHVVSGEAGCPDPVLTPTAIAFDASGVDQSDAVRVYLYVFRNREVFERLRTTIDTCARSFVTDPETFESVEESPFVLAGQGPWGEAFKAALREGLTVAAGSGG
jgi:hypothetical protein